MNAKVKFTVLYHITGTIREELFIAGVGAKQVRIYKFKSHKTFTDKENKIFQGAGNKSMLEDEIKEFKGIREIDAKYLYERDSDGKVDKSKENIRNQIAIFENDFSRISLGDGVESDMQLIKEIVYMEIYHNDIMEQIINNGIIIDDKKFIFYSATTGQVRNTTITLVQEEFYKKYEKQLLCGLTEEIINQKGGCNCGKFLAYKALPLSSSVLPPKEIDIDRCLVVKGLETTVTDLVKYIDIDAKSMVIRDISNGFIEKNIDIEHTDGAGMFLPEELPSSCQVRGGFIKGAMFPFDFRKFAVDVAHNTIVLDAYGKEHDIIAEDIRYVFTTSQLKMWSFYDSWDDYKKCFKDYNCKITINSYANPPKDKVRLAYQYLQTLPMDSDITAICQPTRQYLIDLHKNYEVAIKALGYEAIDEDKEDEEDEDKKRYTSVIGEALKIYPQLINDSYIENKIRKMVNSERKYAKAGKIIIDGYYSYAVPDLYAFCQFLFQNEKNPKGLVPKNHVYNKYYSNKAEIEKVCCLRSPHLSEHEYAKRILIKTDECNEWFQYLDGDTVVSIHDMITKVLMMDVDGDEILISPSKELYELSEELPPLYYNMVKAKPQEINSANIFNTLKAGFENNIIGSISNAITKLWNNETELDKNMINILTAYSNYSIDFPKTGKNIVLGEYKEKYNRLVADKNGFKRQEVSPPYFFIYAKNKSINTCAKPSNSVVDRISIHVQKGTGNLHYSYFKKEAEKFNPMLLCNNELNENGNPKYEVSRCSKKYTELMLLLKKLKSEERKLVKKINDASKKNNQNSKDISAKYDLFHYHCVVEIKKIFVNSHSWFNVNLAVNSIVDIEYYQPEIVTSSKNILWKCFGHVILDNINANLHSKIEVKSKPRMAYLKATRGDEEADNLINETLETPLVAISNAEYEIIKYFNIKYKNDKAILFVLVCLYKNFKKINKLKNGYMIISKRKNGKTEAGKRKRIVYNMNNIQEWAGVKSYKGTLNRLKESSEVDIIEDKACYKIKIDLSVPEESDIAFTVFDLYRPMIFLTAYEDKKELVKCEYCKRYFIKVKNNKTCSEKCSEKLKKINKKKCNNIAKDKSRIA
jgi:hypothetical protein